MLNLGFERNSPVLLFVPTSNVNISRSRKKCNENVKGFRGKEKYSMVGENIVTNASGKWKVDCWLGLRTYRRAAMSQRTCAKSYLLVKLKIRSHSKAFETTALLVLQLSSGTRSGRKPYHWRFNFRLSDNSYGRHTIGWKDSADMVKSKISKKQFRWYKWLSPLSTVLQKLTVVVLKFPIPYLLYNTIHCSHEPASGPHPEPHESSPHSHTLFQKYPFWLLSSHLPLCLKDRLAVRSSDQRGLRLIRPLRISA
jgi:hypothetical protein